MRFTLIKTPTETEAAWAEHQARQGIKDRYFAAVALGNLDTAAEVWLEATAYDRMNRRSSSLRDELDDQPVAIAA
ncbi:hypothetical protein OTB20_19450 [Streptomyces sp. H27-H1]|uniref:hypothetical protein n=1 Tax=Streptomyces sp. H27-H1 TaxID=2996461 RepID=UPI002270194D|nr:hypothetical protein [Streptomyces sp. H27-H1]MCY0928333.1 hypothetical protein [Streptomyces sp. H27-H1]